MNTKLYTYKRKNVFILLLLTGILFSMYSCQYEVVPIGTIVPVGASSIQNNWMNIREGLDSFSLSACKIFIYYVGSEVFYDW